MEWIDMPTFLASLSTVFLCYLLSLKVSCLLLNYRRILAIKFLLRTPQNVAYASTNFFRNGGVT